MAAELPGQMRIGAVLREARERAGLDLRDVSERTKIRPRYLAALEDEHWDDLPSPAYAKGFLRTYAQLLDLDGEALVDEYRRQVEGGGDVGYSVGEGVLHRSRVAGDQRDAPVSRRLAVGGLIAAVVAALIAIGLLSGGDDEPTRERDRKAAKRSGGRDRSDKERERDEPRGSVSLRLRALAPVEVCLVDGSGRALIDRQVLAAGTEDEFRRPRFELRFPGGFAPEQVEVELDGNRRRLPRADGPAAYAIVAPKQIKLIDPPEGEDCP